MRFLDITVAALAACTVAGCAGDTNPPGGVLACTWVTTPGGSGACTAAAAYGGQSGNSAVVFSTASNNLSVTIVLPGHLGAGTYNAASTGISGSITVTNGGTSYTTTTNAGSNPGTFALVITSVKVTASADGALVYGINGSLDATVPAASGGSGNAVVHVDVSGT